MVEEVKKIITPKLLEHDISVYDVEYIKEDNCWTLRVTIDKVGGVDIDTCVEATHIINPILDEYDLIKSSYVLDVTSKGIGDENE